jgi:hypothetical protein
MQLALCIGLVLSLRPRYRSIPSSNGLRPSLLAKSQLCRESAPPSPNKQGTLAQKYRRRDAWLGVHALLLIPTRAKIEAFLGWAWDHIGGSNVDPVLDRPDQVAVTWPATKKKCFRQKVEPPSHIRPVQRLRVLFSAVVPETGTALLGGTHAQTSVGQCRPAA